MALSAAVLAEDPEQSIHRLQQQRKTRIAVAVGVLVAVFAVTGIFVILSYQDGPEAAAGRSNQASP